MQIVYLSGGYQTNFNGKAKPKNFCQKTKNYYENLFREFEEEMASKRPKLKESVLNLEKRNQEYYDSLFREIDEKIAQGGDKNIYSLICKEPAVTFENPRTGVKTTIFSKDSNKIVNIFDTDRKSFNPKDVLCNVEIYKTPKGNIYKMVRTVPKGKNGMLRNCHENSDKFIWTGEFWAKVSSAKKIKNKNSHKKSNL